MPKYNTQQAQEKQEKPAALDFDRETWAAAVAQAGGIEAMVEQLKMEIPDPAERVRVYMRLSAGQTIQLPQSERKLVWDAIAQQLPGYVEDMKALKQNIGALYQGMAKAGAAMAQNVQAVTSAIQQAGMAAKQAIDELLDGDEIADKMQLWETLAPYINAEFDENPAAYEAAPTYDLIAAAARRARADGKDIPFLGAEKSEEAEKEEKRRARIKDTWNRRENARQQGRIPEESINAAIIANKKTGFDYLTSNKIKAFPPDIDVQNLSLKENGSLKFYVLNGDKEVRDMLKDVDSLHIAFLSLLLSLAYRSDLTESNSGNAILPIYIPSILNAAHIDARPHEYDKDTKSLIARDTSMTRAELRRERFMEFLRPLFNLAAFIGDDLYSVCGFHSYDADTETINITTPYLFKLVENAAFNSPKRRVIHDIFHADILSENQAAVEVAERIAQGIITRGIHHPDRDNEKGNRSTKKRTTKTAPDGTKTVTEVTYAPDPGATVSKSITKENGDVFTLTKPLPEEKTYTYKVKFSTLIDTCPELKRELSAIRNATGPAEQAAIDRAAGAQEIEAARKLDHKHDPQKINKKLADVFTAATNILLKKSRMPQYYLNLRFETGKLKTFKAPTNSTLNEMLLAIHGGKNPKYQNV